MTWTLDPEEYLCPAHKVDLTDEVRSEVLARPTVIVSGTDGLTADERKDRNLAQRGYYDPTGPFSVEVECPGAGAANKAGETHRQRFSGLVQ